MAGPCKCEDCYDEYKELEEWLRDRKLSIKSVRLKLLELNIKNVSSDVLKLINDYT
jgi:hypothetical protein